MNIDFGDIKDCFRAIMFSVESFSCGDKIILVKDAPESILALSISREINRAWQQSPAQHAEKFSRETRNATAGAEEKQ